jgi:phage protein D
MDEAPLTAAAIHTAQPRVEVDGQSLEMVRDLLQGIALREEEGGLAALELRLSASAVESERGLRMGLAEETLIELGKELKVAMGDEAGQTEMFRGRISALEFVLEEGDQPQLLVQAEDVLMGQRHRRYSRIHPAGPLSRILQSVATETGLVPIVRGLDLAVGAQAQLNESNLAFLRRLLADHDADLHVIGRELHMLPRQQIRRDAVTLRMGRQLHRLSIVADLADQVSRVTLAGFDPARGQQVKATGELKAPGAKAGLGPGVGRAAPELLAAQRESRAEHLGGRQVQDQGEAQALADAAFARVSRRFVTLEATVAGNPRIRVGTHVTTDGVGRRFSNTYYVTGTLHRYDLAEGYVTELTAECAFLGP